jgi:hypothetical protein
VWLGLKINREKTCVIDLRGRAEKPGVPGYSFRYEDELYGSNRKYWNMQPSRSALARENVKKSGVVSPELAAIASLRTPMP